MIIHNYKEQIVKDTHFGETCELSEYDLKEIPTKVEWVCYWYQAESYEGWGYLLMRAEGKWYVHSFSHCSCYGPLESCDLREGFDTIDIMIEGGSEEFNEEMKGLFELARKYASEWK